MTPTTLAYINKRLTEADINYHFVRYNTSEGSPLVYPYSVGEYNESEPTDESGQQKATFTVRTWTRGSWLELEQIKAKIKALFPPVGGDTAILPDGSGVAISYLRSQPIPTGDMELKRIDTTLDIKEWSE